MADKRMFSKTVVLTDDFLEMPMSARCLYFTLGMLADDDGFVDSPNAIMRQCQATKDDMRILITKRYILEFESGVIVIRHWRMNNYLKNDRHHETAYVNELHSLSTDKNGAYLEAGYKLDTDCVQTVSIDKNSIDKYREDKSSKEDNSNELSTPSKAVRHRYGEYNNVLLTDDEVSKLQAEFPDWMDRVERLSSYMESHGKTYKNHLATIRNWARNEVEKQAVTHKNAKAQELDEFYQMAQRWAENEQE